MTDEILARLEADKVNLGLKLVGDSAAFARAAEANPTATPAAYVIELEEIPGAPPFSGDDIQKIDVAVGVVLVLSSVADTLGGAARIALKPLRIAVKTSLLGWAPLTGYAPLSRGRSHLLAFRDARMWWQDIYLSSFYERKP
jgi:hypothetical protein